MRWQKKLVLVLSFFLAACGSLTFSPPQNEDNESADGALSPNTDPTTSTVFVFATDYSSSGQLYTASYVDGVSLLENSNLKLLGTEAFILLADNLLYILHAGASYNSVSSDNVQIVDPFDGTHAFKTRAQYSTGNGTNPLSLVVKDNRAFISLYSPESDGDNVDENGRPGDVIEMDLDSGNIVKRYSFYDDLNDDGDKQARAYHMLLNGNVLYVILQDLVSNTYEANSPGLIGKIDVAAQETQGVIKLNGRNPAHLALSADGTRLFVASTDDRAYNSIYSGLEVIDLATETTELFITDDGFGGYIERLQVAENAVFAVVSKYDTSTFTFNSKVMRFPQDISTSETLEDFLDYGSDIRALYVQDDFLWLAYRTISTSTGDSEPNIKLYDTNTSSQLGETLYPVAAGVSIAGW